MFVKHLVFGIFFLLLLASCDGPAADAVPGFDESPTAVRGVLATAVQEFGTPLPIMITVTESVVVPTSLPVATKTIPVAARVEATSDVLALGFSGLRFSLTADGVAQSEFAAGTDEVFALWEYARMSPEDSVRRIWFRDDQIWLTREEGWNWGEYGSDGTMRDISVYDNEGSGLPPATYRLQLYVNNELHAEGIFVVLGS